VLKVIAGKVSNQTLQVGEKLGMLDEMVVNVVCFAFLGYQVSFDYYI
jgi:hypothetical protein